MGFLLVLPAWLCWYLYRESPAESPAVLVWLLFAYLAIMLHLGYQTKTDKWQACDALEKYTGYERLPAYCWESE